MITVEVEQDEFQRGDLSAARAHGLDEFDVARRRGCTRRGIRGQESLGRGELAVRAVRLAAELRAQVADRADGGFDEQRFHGDQSGAAS